MIDLLLISAVLAATPLAATPAPTPDAHQLSLARETLQAVLPPETREALFNQMIGGMIQNLKTGLEQAPALQQAFHEKPELRIVFNSFVDRQRSLAVDDLRSNMPAFIEAMSRAYARRFTEQDLRQIRDFFSQPVGQKYITTSGSVFMDPDVAAWQRGTMTRAQQRLPEEMKLFRQQVDAVMGDGKK